VDEPLDGRAQGPKGRLKPQEQLLVADAMTGQDAVNVAQAFHESLGLTGVVLTKVEGDARGGAALSIRRWWTCPSSWWAWAKSWTPWRLSTRTAWPAASWAWAMCLTLVEKA
jgi:signal recognition particle GTPase